MKIVKVTLLPHGAFGPREVTITRTFRRDERGRESSISANVESGGALEVIEFAPRPDRDWDDDVFAKTIFAPGTWATAEGTTTLPHDADPDEVVE